MFADATLRRPPLDHRATSHDLFGHAAVRGRRRWATLARSGIRTAGRSARTTRAVGPAWELDALRRLYGA